MEPSRSSARLRSCPSAIGPVCAPVSARQAKRIASTGFRRFDDGAAWVRIAGLRRRRFSGSVFSFEVTGTHTLVTSACIICHNCFPKDVTALKQLAGNSGYHFQLLNAVIEVNELQKRRVIAKLEKHLGSLVGKQIALLGLAFKPNTDDMREATSLVLSARLQAAGAHVRALRPGRRGARRGKLMPGIDFADDALERGRGRRRGGARHRVGRVSRARLRPPSPRRWRRRASSTGATRSTPTPCAAAGLIYEGIGRS